jgi:hypothetical protein
VGGDPHEDQRTATPLELLFDLTFIVALGTAANELAHSAWSSKKATSAQRLAGHQDRLPHHVLPEGSISDIREHALGCSGGQECSPEIAL